MTLAPIILFVYNRPWHTEQTLESLMMNELADQSTLYIYSDGPKENATKEEKQKIVQVREVVKQKKWCKEVIIIERETNTGLANSVIEGVSEVIEKHERVIVLEDDILTGKYFLNFMNDGLNLYQKDKQVYGISGYRFPSSKPIKNQTYFLPVMSSWGYATWSDRWNTIDFNGNELLDIVHSKKLESKLHFGTINYYQMLKNQTLGRNDSWAVRFYVSMILQNGVFLFPNNNLLKNIGLDGSGVHCEKDSNLNQFKDFDSTNIKPIKQEVKLDLNILNSFKDIKTGPKKSIVSKTQTKIGKFIAPEIKNYIKRKLGNNKKTYKIEFEFLKQIPRYTKTSVIVDGYKLIIPDSASFLFMYDEIFRTEIYKFKTKKQKPYIIDGGANIGLATIYFKKLYPDSEIVAFEPDSDIYNILDANINSYAFDTVKLIKKGLWNEETNLKFQSEGADAGLLATFNKSDDTNFQNIPVTSLKPYLHKTVDFLKLDIEGAETVVLKDIAEDLDKVERIFIEYHSFVGKEQSLNEILDILKQSNFRLYITSPGVSNKSPFVKINVYRDMDMQLNIYGIKET